MLQLFKNICRIPTKNLVFNQITYRFGGGHHHEIDREKIKLRD